MSDGTITWKTDRVVLKAWVRWIHDGRVGIGMSSVTRYDEQGNIIEHKVEPTGAFLTHE